MEVCGQLQALATIPIGKKSWHQMNRKLYGPQSPSGQCGEEKKNGKSIVVYINNNNDDDDDDDDNNNYNNHLEFGHYTILKGRDTAKYRVQWYGDVYFQYIHMHPSRCVSYTLHKCYIFTLRLRTKCVFRFKYQKKIKDQIHTVCTYSLLMNLPFSSEQVSLNTRFR
jgi:hypothetical protein